MPSLPPVPNVLHCQLQYQEGGDNNVNVTQFFRYSGGPPTATDLNALAATVWGHAAIFGIYQDNFTNLIAVKLTDLSSAMGAQGEHSQVQEGSRGTDVLAGGTCVLVNYSINRRYRGGKPRSYFPFFVTTDLLTRQSWDGAAVTGLDGTLSTYFGDVIGSSSGTTTITDHVNISYYDGFTVQTNPGTGRAKNVPTRRTVPLVDVIQSFQTSSVPGSQRRRNK